MDKVVCGVFTLLEIGFVLAVDEFLTGWGVWGEDFFVAFGFVDFFEDVGSDGERGVTVCEGVGVFCGVELLDCEIFENFDSFCGNH